MLLGMAGMFTAIVRAPLTGIILIVEMSGSLTQLLSLSLVSICAYLVADLCRSKPVYESLLENLHPSQQSVAQPGERIFLDLPVHYGSFVSQKRIAQVHWPKDCLITNVAVSYTHLDVYKRQLRIGSKLLYRQKFPESLWKLSLLYFSFVDRRIIAPAPHPC